MTTCHYCHREITEVWQLVGEVNTPGILDAVLVGRECVAKAKADGWDLPQRVTP